MPLTASASGEHVLNATSHSKSVLRAVAGKLTAQHEWVDYFPSYELVTAPVFGGRAYEANMRQVAASGVDFVMGTFLREFCETDQPAAPPPARRQRQVAKDDDIVCDEAALEFFAR